MQSYPSTRQSSRVRPPPNPLNGNGNGTSHASISPNNSFLNLVRLRNGSTAVIEPEIHPAMHTGRTALITGAASGIGFAAARAFATLGLRVVLVDINEPLLDKARAELVTEFGAENVLAIQADVSKIDEVEKLRDQVFETYGEVNVLLNNAGIGLYGGALTEPENWRTVIDVNLFGVLNITQAFSTSMIHQENPSIIINTGSKQGLTNPPGNAAYNASKAAVRILTENLAYELRNAEAKVTAHLFVPGWTYTGMTGAPKDDEGDKPAGAWTAEQTVDYLLSKIRDGRFYIICPDNETSEDLDRLRIKWAAGDIVEGRPALSRWHPEYKAVYDDYVHSGLQHFEESRVHARGRFRPEPTVQEDNL